MSNLLRIAQLGDDVLRKKAQTVVVNDHQLMDLMPLSWDMVATCLDADGIGLAAPQVYDSLRMFIIAPHPTRRRPNIPQVAPIILLNPEIIKRSKGTNTSWEGCLSIPGLFGQVRRSDWVEVRYFDLSAKLVRRRLSGLLARIFQHEFDHINGKVFTDRVIRSSLVMESAYLRLTTREEN